MTVRNCKGSLQSFLSSTLGRLTWRAYQFAMGTTYPWLLTSVGVPYGAAKAMTDYWYKKASEYTSRVEAGQLEPGDEAIGCLIVVGFENSMAGLLVLASEKLEFDEARQLVRSMMPEDLKDIVENCCPALIRAMNEVK